VLHFYYDMIFVHYRKITYVHMQLYVLVTSQKDNEGYQRLGRSWNAL